MSLRSVSEVTQLLGNALNVPLDPFEYKSLDDGTAVGAGRHRICSLGEADIGVWQADPGLIGGTTNDEIFVVLEGRAEITFEDTMEMITVGPGDVVRLNAGQRNRWKTIERLRKVSVSVSRERTG